MKRAKYHGILVNMAFSHPEYPESFHVINKKAAGDWKLFCVEIENEKIEMLISEIQEHMRSDQNFYNHLYNDEELIIILKKIFKVTSHESSWGEIIAYGKELKIPEEQLDFWPNRFQDEIHYFKENN